MSHKVHPYGHRLGIIRDWKSRWFDIKDTYKDKLEQDITIYRFLASKLKGMYVSNVEIERGIKAYRIIIETSRPGLIIGRNGEGMTKLRGDLLRFMSRKGLAIKEDLKLDIKELKAAEGSAMIVAQMIAESLEKRLPFRRVMKQMLEKAYANKDVQGVKITLSGILGGSNMARVESKKIGRISLQTLRADIDYALFEALLPLGKIGIKVWIYKGEVFHKKSGLNTIV